MKKYILASLVLGTALHFSMAEDKATEVMVDDAAAAQADPEVDPESAIRVPDEATESQVKPKSVKKTAAKKRVEKANNFLVGPDWEFDGFVAGGEDQKIRSMFYLNDVIYLNVGAEQGLDTGDVINVFKRGDRVRDPQTGKFIGYEVRKAAATRVTDQINDGTCAVRVMKSYEPIEIGDLVKKED